MSFNHPDELHTSFSEAMRTGDIESLVDLYEADAVQVQQDGTTLSGADKLRDVFARLVDGGSTMQGIPQKVIVVGDIALTSTHYEMSSDDPDGSHPITAFVTVSSAQQRSTSTRHRSTAFWCTHSLSKDLPNLCCSTRSFCCLSPTSWPTT